jgi:hypothetical protein
MGIGIEEEPDEEAEVFKIAPVNKFENFFFGQLPFEAILDEGQKLGHIGQIALDTAEFFKGLMFFLGVIQNVEKSGVLDDAEVGRGSEVAESKVLGKGIGKGFCLGGSIEGDVIADAVGSAGEGRAVLFPVV